MERRRGKPGPLPEALGGRRYRPSSSSKRRSRRWASSMELSRRTKQPSIAPS
jgi:hypothetical protein